MIQTPIQLPVGPPTPAPTTLPRVVRRRVGAQPGVALALLTLWLGILWMVVTPPLNAPDEPAHLQAVMQVRVLHILPELHFDFSTNPAGEIVRTPVDPATTAYIARAGFHLPAKLEPNESWQPPLYYLVTGLVTQVIPPDPVWILYASRLVSVLFGAGMVYFCWAATRELAPAAPMWAVAAAGVVALLPQAAAGRAVVANDTAVNCCVMAAFYVWFRGLRCKDYDPWMLRAGAAVGLAVMSSLSAALLLPGLGLVVLFRAFQVGQGRAIRGPRLGRAVRMSLGAGAVLLLICLPWVVHNLLVYGEPTGTAGVLQYARATYPLYNLSLPRVQQDFVRQTWESFWGWFGWRDAPLPVEFYQQAVWGAVVLLALSGLAGLSWLLYARRTHRRLPAYAWQAGLLLALVVVELCVSYVQFSLNVAYQAQGRLFFPALLPLALVFTGGLQAIPPGRVPKIVALSIPLLWLAAMNAVGLLVIQHAPLLP